MGSQNASIATNIDTWQRNTDQRRKKTSNDVLNVTKKGIQPKITKKCSQ